MTTVTFGSDSGVSFAGTEDSAFSSFLVNSVLDNEAATVSGTGLLRFTGLSNIPAGANITAAKLEITFTSGQGGGAAVIRFRNSLRAWVESQVTWNDYITSTGWSTPGAGNTTTDVGATDLGTITYPGGFATGPVESTSNTGLIAWIQDFVDGVHTNLGFAVGDDNAGLQYALPAGTDGTRPLLTVEYDEPVVTFPVFGFTA